MDAPSTWIVPHIAEELAVIAPVHKITGTRWKSRQYYIFSATLERTTRGLLDRNHPIIARFLEEMWIENVILPPRTYYEEYVRAAASHGYEPLLKHLSDKLIQRQLDT